MKNAFWRIYSLAVWFAALAAAAASCFTGMHNLYALVLFLIIPEWFAMIHIGNREKLKRDEILRQCPRGCRKAAVICFAYGIFQFMLGMYLLREGGPQIHEGVYCLWDHGFIREITEAEYKSLMRTEGRMFTGNFLIFATVAMAYFAARAKIHEKKQSFEQGAEK